MKTINLRGIKESLSDGEMKMVKGGIVNLPTIDDPGTLPGGSGNNADPSAKCIATKSMDGTGGYQCSSSAATAEAYAGPHGWWCCNCADATSKC